MACLPRLVVVEFLGENRKAGLQRAIEQIGLGKTERQNALQVADVGLHAQGLAQAQEVVGAVVEPDEGPARPLTPPVRPMLFFPFSLTLRVRSTVPFFSSRWRSVTLGSSGFKLLEEAQLIQPLQAELPQALVVNLAFLQRDLAADDLVASGGIALELDSPHIKLLALVHVDIEEDQLLFFVEGGVGNRSEVDVSQLAIGFAQVLQTFGDLAAVEDIAVFHGKQRAQGLDVGDRLVFLKVISPRLILCRLPRSAW